MSNYGYKFLLLILRGLMYLKRGIVTSSSWIWRQLTTLDAWYRRIIGFRIFKVFFTIKRQFNAMLPGTWRDGIIYFLGRRGTLQVMLFLIAVIMMIPHSRLYTRDTTTIAGRKTLLYALVGPGDQDFEIEEVGASELIGFAPSASWREGAVVSEQGVGITQVPSGPQEIAAISAGGSALTKPTILPGNAVAGTGNTGRTEVIVHEVKQGDVIGLIASQYGVSVETILWANGLSVRSYIRPGDKLKILPVNGVVHTVKRGDTVGKIARTYSATDKSIVEFNRLQSDGSDLVVGEILIIPGGRLASAVQINNPASTPLRGIAAPPPSIAAPAGSGYLWPAGVRRITQYYGLRHTGVDIAGPIGTGLYAAKAGTVIRSQCGWNGGYGCHIILDHGGGVTTLYGHASQLYVSVGEQVVQGQTIAAMGSTGRSTGPHLHFEVRVNGKKQNPLSYVR